MKTAIIKGLEGQELEEMENAFRSSGTIRKRLRQLIQERVDSSRDETRKRIQYDSPSWAYVQADQIGFERACYEIISLLSEKQVEKS